VSDRQPRAAADSNERRKGVKEEEWIPEPLDI
jgi:hypothetical protein